jgi:formylglycine-generating enzyme required for sulfatase activity
VNVSWDDALKFCEWLSGKENRTYGLPTEAEWEYACRAGGTEAYSFGKDAAKLAEYAWFDDNAGKTGAQSVGKKKPNAWGLHDMHGNVWEWCLDGIRTYQKDSVRDPVGDPKKERARRGGSWADDARHCRSASRYINARGNRPYTGFRVVMRPAEKVP